MATELPEAQQRLGKMLFDFGKHASGTAMDQYCEINYPQINQGACVSPDESGGHGRPIDNGPPEARVARPARSFKAIFLEPFRSALS